MPRIKLTKTAIDALPTPVKDAVYWDIGCPGFGVKVTPKGRKVFIVLYRTGGAGSRLRKYTLGPLWAHHLAPGPRRCAKGPCCKARGPRSGSRETRGQAKAGSRSGRSASMVIFRCATTRPSLGTVGLP
jgi:hypothetical protein